MDKWVIISSDGDVDYTDVWGFYDTEAEANRDLPTDTDDIAYRVVRVQPAADLKDYAEEVAS